MHVSTATGQEGDTAQLETQRMTPQRDCHIQCLQFYYYHSGNESDTLNIWIREFENEQDLTGTRRLMGQITGSRASHWRLHHVSLNATMNFQVVFEAQKGAGRSTGGFSVDDINLYETECPHLTLQIDDFQRVLNTSAPESRIYSSRQYSSEGYAYRFAVIFYKTYFGLYVQLLSGDYDDQLKWPSLRKQMTFQMLDQTPNIQQQMAKQWSFTTNEYHADKNGVNYFDNPRKIGTPVFTDDKNKQVYGGVLYGLYMFSTLEEMQNREFLKGGSAVFTLNFQDLTPLVNGSTLPCPQVRPMNFVHQPTDGNEGPCSWTPPAQTSTPPAQTSTPPAQTSTPPAQTSTPPAQTSTPPAQTSTPPAQTSTPPAQTTTPPAKTTTGPAQTTTPPPQTTTPPAQTTTAPAKTTTGLAQTTTAPAKTTTGPAKTTTGPAQTTTPLAQTTTPLAQTATPPAQTTTLPAQTPSTFITTPSLTYPLTTVNSSFSPNMKPSAILIFLLTVICLMP